MSMREWMNENSTIVTIAAVALLVGALVLLVTQAGSGPRGAGDAWYLDTETGEIFLAASSEFPPITSPDGNEAVRVHRFSCGACTESQMFIGYYEKYTDEARRELTEQRQRMAQQPQQPAQGDNPYAQLQAQAQQMEARRYGAVEGQLYSVDGENWIQAVGGGTSRVQQQVHDHCEGRERANRCDP